MTANALSTIRQQHLPFSTAETCESGYAMRIAVNGAAGTPCALLASEVVDSKIDMRVIENSCVI